jgi:hypothetical protein
MSAVTSPRKKNFSLSSAFSGTKNRFLSAMKPSPGFSCWAGGAGHHEFASELVLQSRKTTRRASAVITDVIWSHPSTGLEACVQYSAFSETGVVEIEGRLTNRSRRTLRKVSGPISLCIQMDMRRLGGQHVTTVSGGGPTTPCYPPPSYRVNSCDIPLGGNQMLIGGRYMGSSTDADSPYAIVTDTAGREGFWVAYEWPCKWYMSISHQGDAENPRLEVIAHVGWTSFDLKAGDSIYMPKIDLGFFKGDDVAGSNALRRHVTRNIIRPVDDKPHVPPVFYNSWAGPGGVFTEETLREEVDAYANLGMEYFVVDAGWFGSCRDAVGNWEKTDKKKFPNGMAPLAEYVQSKGMKFGSWLEIELAMKNSHWPKAHPDWFHNAGNSQDWMYGKERYEDLLVRLDDPSIRSKVADFMVRWVEENRIDWLRWDFNNGPIMFWAANEAEGQMGRIQLEYGAGLLELRKEFTSRCPHVHLETCAGGGYRYDLGTLRCAHSAWMNDNDKLWQCVRRYQAGLNRLLPGCYANSAQVRRSHYKLGLDPKPGKLFPLEVLRSRMGGSLCIADNPREWTPPVRRQLKAEITRYKQTRRFLMEDYYPLFQPARLSDYDGWQFNDPATGEGFFMIFRCDSPDPTVTVELPGLKKGVKYRAIDLDTDAKRTLTGGKATKINIPKKNGVAWLKYCRQS